MSYLKIYLSKHGITLDDLHDKLESICTTELISKQVNNFWGTRYPEMDYIFLIELSIL